MLLHIYMKALSALSLRSSNSFVILPEIDTRNPWYLYTHTFSKGTVSQWKVRWIRRPVFGLFDINS